MAAAPGRERIALRVVDDAVGTELAHERCLGGDLMVNVGSLTVRSGPTNGSSTSETAHGPATGISTRSVMPSAVVTLALP